MKSIDQVYGLEKDAFVGAAVRGTVGAVKSIASAAARGGMKPIRGAANLMKNSNPIQGWKSIGNSLKKLPKPSLRTVSPRAGMNAVKQGTSDALSRGAKNFSKKFGEVGAMEKVFLAGSGASVVSMAPGVDAAKIYGGKGSMSEMFLNAKSGMTDYGQKARDLIQSANLNKQRTYIPKVAEDVMYNHREIMERASIKKEANAKSLGKYLALGVGLGTAAPLAMYGVGKGVRYSSQRTLNRDYEAVVKEDPSLKSKKAHDLYRVLHRSAPTVAREPLVASKVLKNMMEIPQITPQTFADVLRLEQLHQSTEMPFYGINHSLKPSDVM